MPSLLVIYGVLAEMTGVVQNHIKGYLIRLVGQVFKHGVRDVKLDKD